MMGIGVGSDGLAYRFHQEIVKRLNLTEKDFQDVIARFAEKIEQIESMVRI